MNKECENNCSFSEKKNGISWLHVLVAIGYPFPVAGVLFCIFCSFYLGTEIMIFLILTILTLLGYLGEVIFILRKSHKVDEHSPSPIVHTKKPDSSSDESKAVAAAIFGGILLSHALRKRTH